MEEIKNFELYTFSVERFQNSESNDDKNYLNIVIKQFDFEDGNVDYFEEHLDEIKEKNNEEFLDWLEEKADEDGLNLEVFLEDNDVPLYISEGYERFYNEENKEEIAYEKFIDDDNFELTSSQPYTEEKYFLSMDEVKKEIRSQYPFYNSKQI